MVKTVWPCLKRYECFLASNNPVLNDTRVGLGNFSADGDSRSGQILVAAAP